MYVIFISDSHPFCFVLIKNQQVSPQSKSDDDRRERENDKIESQLKKGIESRKNISSTTTYTFMLMD